MTPGQGLETLGLRLEVGTTQESKVWAELVSTDNPSSNRPEAMLAVKTQIRKWESRGNKVRAKTSLYPVRGWPWAATWNSGSDWGASKGVDHRLITLVSVAPCKVYKNRTKFLPLICLKHHRWKEKYVY